MPNLEFPIPKPLKSPFPYFGGKSRAAKIVWSRIGDVPNYVEPFAATLAVLLLRPHPPQKEVVNDLDGFITNFWRAIVADPDTTAFYADWPVNEIDLLARYRWLKKTGTERVERLKTDPHYYDAKVAGWWVWCISAWVGGRFLSDKPPARKLPEMKGRGVNRHRIDNMAEYFGELSQRLRRVTITCGDWTRVVQSKTVTTHNGLTGIFLDPPYSVVGIEKKIYKENQGVSNAVKDWAIANGNNPLLRLALCGYEGEHEMPSDWECVAWKANGGYGNRRKNSTNENRHKERIWFSPHCLRNEY